LSSSLKTDAASSSEISVNICHTTGRHILGDNHRLPPVWPSSVV
jgi:hypothetical protein